MKLAEFEKSFVRGASLGIMITLFFAIKGSPATASAEEAARADAFDQPSRLPWSNDSMEAQIRAQLLKSAQAPGACGATRTTCCCGDPANCKCGAATQSSCGNGK